MTHNAPQKLTAPDLHQIEFFRQGMALLPEPSDKRPGVAFFLQGNDFQLTQRFCTCTLSESRSCPHIKQLLKAFKAMRQKSDQTLYEDRFRASIWYRLAVILGEASVQDPQAVEFKTQTSGDQTIIKVLGLNKTTLVHYFSAGSDHIRFLERCASTLPDGGIPHRGWALSRLSDITRTDNEKNMNAQRV